MLEFASAPEREKPATLLGALGPAHAPEGLVNALAYPVLGVRESAVQSLACIEDEDCVSSVIKLLRASAETIRLAAAILLEELAAPSAVDALIARLGDESSSVRSMASRALLACGPRSLPKIAQALADKLQKERGRETQWGLVGIDSERFDSACRLAIGALRQMLSYCIERRLGLPGTVRRKLKAAVAG